MKRFEEAAPWLRGAARSASSPHLDVHLEERVAAGLVETLMLQLHGAARNVPPETVAGWEVDPEVVWKKARDNTLWDDPVEAQLAISPTGGRVVHVTGGFFASSRLLVLDRYLPVRRRQGALAMLPGGTRCSTSRSVSGGACTRTSRPCWTWETASTSKVLARPPGTCSGGEPVRFADS